MLSFHLPELGDEVVGNVTLEIGRDGEDLAAQHYFNCHDSRQAKVLYMLPAKAYAEETTIVTVGLSNFDGQPHVIQSNARCDLSLLSLLLCQYRSSSNLRLVLHSFC